MCYSLEGMSLLGDQIDEMTLLHVIWVTNKVLGPESHLIGKDHPVEHLSVKLERDRHMVRHCLVNRH